MSLYIAYVLWVVIFYGIYDLMARKAPVTACLLIWFAWMCWEVYDMHPDHEIAYSAVFLGAAYRAVHRTSEPAKTGVSAWRRT